METRLLTNRQSQGGRLGGRKAAKNVKPIRFGKGWRINPQQPKPAPEAEPSKGGKTLLQLGANDCRWPVGSKPPWRFCARPKVAGKSYCEEHQARAYMKPGDRRA